MSRRKNTPQHNYWYNRIDGQIKNCMNSHPNWFNFKNEHERKDIINSLSKRIVGEIVAELKSATRAADPGVGLESAGKNAFGLKMKALWRRMVARCPAPFNLFKEVK